MSDIILKDLQINFPEDFTGKPTRLEIVEWLEFELGQNSSLLRSNPLSRIEISDCEIDIKGATINGQAIIM